MDNLNIPESRRGWYFKAIDSRRRGYHGFAASEFRKALREQFNQFYDDSITNPAMFERNLDRITVDPIQEAFNRVYLVVSGNFAVQTLTNFKSHGIEMHTKQEEDEEEEMLRDLFINAINGFVSLQLLDIMNSITDTTVSTIGQLIRKLQQDPSITLDQFKEGLQEQYQRVILARSILIGRTEIIRASNKGMLLGAAQTGVPMNKIWVSTRDNRVRTTPPDQHDHLRPDGQTRRLDQPFNVSGQLLQYPADPNGSPGNTVNCRCTMSFQLI